MDMNGGGGVPMGALSPDGVDFSNETQASEFLELLLDDDQLKIIGNAYATYFWYGTVVAITLASAFNFAQWVVLRSR